MTSGITEQQELILLRQRVAELQFDRIDFEKKLIECVTLLQRLHAVTDTLHNTLHDALELAS